MFSGETAVELTTRLDDRALFDAVEQAFAGLGRARVDARGGLTVVPNDTMGSVFTEVAIDGSVRRLGDGYEVVVRHACKPTTACWLAAVVLMFTFVGGVGVLAVPLMEKKQVGRRVRDALGRLEDVADDRPG
jgi:hypothetical protein